MADAPAETTGSPATSDISSPSIAACLLTTGQRPDDLAVAVASARELGVERCVVLANGCDAAAVPSGVELIVSETNLGVPGGRQRLADEVDADLLLFLDDDARLIGDWLPTVISKFVADPNLAVVSLRLVDQTGATARRHTPRVGSRGVAESGPVATFLGGASIIRRSALFSVGGYWTALFYGHEELELAWRLYDAGFTVFYDAAAQVYHPRTEIGRHADGWRLTGRNRVMIARRDLPWPIALTHVAFWLVAGTTRAPGRVARRAYLSGWRNGWRVPVGRAPIHWRTVWRLSEVGRPPVV